MNKLSFRQIAFFCSGILLMSACSTQQQGPELTTGEKTQGAVGNVFQLEQGWTNDTQQLFYFTNQGSRILPYDWYLNLEQANTKVLFRDNKHMESLKYLPAKPSRWNPDGLAVGFVKDVDQSNQSWVGFNCAACHTGQIRYQNVEMRIDGGPTLADFETFNINLVKALEQTYQNKQKFNRFADAVLGKNTSNEKRESLKQDLAKQTKKLAQRNLVNHPDPDQPQYGYGRVDAIGAIFNQILSRFNDMPNNGRASDAPVSYPFLWGTHQSDVVQWPGFAPNGPMSVGALIRNGGEVLGVYGEVDIPEDKNKKSYASSLAIKNLGLLEQWVAELRSPQWPEKFLPAINHNLVPRGQELYQAHCVDCHSIIKREDEGKPYQSVLTPLSEVKTDPQELINMFATRPAGKFDGRKELVVAGPVINAQTSGLEPLVNAVVGSLLRHPLQTVAAAFEEFEGGVAGASAGDGIDIKNMSGDKLEQLIQRFVTARQLVEKEQKRQKTTAEPTEIMVYKARPLNGIWATAPYLHNGSVPNLYELLLKPEERTKKFYVGSRHFDPAKVGFITNNAPGTDNEFLFDTQLLGNSNEGHNYGADTMNEQDRLALVEYLKTL
ncbi:di-heme-cytochrome C peroxidase [Aliikangiella maris]|uniref:Di-heme-cytochrome C peroxidase n=2 Tax=Aliikangiella maris TaxID=3162458 RepID=A0ABV2BUE9_9GAMM